jgi:hypothetical protein
MTETVSIQMAVYAEAATWSDIETVLTENPNYNCFIVVTDDITNVDQAIPISTQRTVTLVSGEARETKITGDGIITEFFQVTGSARFMLGSSNPTYNKLTLEDAGISVNGASAEFIMIKGAIEPSTVSGVIIDNNAIFTMHGGDITGSADYGVHIMSGVFIMDGGTISFNASGVNNNGRFDMYDGTISDSFTWGVYNTGILTLLDDGKMINNTNGVRNDTGGDFFMTGGTISGSTNYGVHNTSMFSLSDNGKISGGTGNGVMNDAGGTFTMEGGEISGNNSGVAVYDGNFHMKGGNIMNNSNTGTAWGPGYGVFVGESADSFTMSDDAWIGQNPNGEIELDFDFMSQGNPIVPITVQGVLTQPIGSAKMRIGFSLILPTEWSLLTDPDRNIIVSSGDPNTWFTYVDVLIPTLGINSTGDTVLLAP